MSSIEILILILAVIAIIVAIGWRAGGLWGAKMARDAEREKEER